MINIIKNGLFILILITLTFTGICSHAQDNASEGERITASSVVIDELEFKNMNMSEVLKILSLKSGLNIINAALIPGKVTVFLKDVDAYDALRIILDTNNLAYVQDQDGIFILSAEEFEKRSGFPFGQKAQTKVINLRYSRAEDMIKILDQVKGPSGKIFQSDKSEISFVIMDSPAKIESMAQLVEELDVPLKTKNFRLDNIKPEEIASILQEILTKNIGKIQIDGDQRGLTITDTDRNMRLIEQRVYELDQAKKEVIIGTKVFQIILNDEHKSGVDWEAIISQYKSISYKGMDRQKPDTVYTMSFGTVSEEDYSVLEDALDTVGNINTILNSRLVASNNKKSQLSIKTLQTSISSMGAKEIDLTAQPEISFLVTPTKGDDDVFNLHIIPSETSFLIVADGVPVADDLMKDAVDIKVKEGETAVIGGIFMNVMVESMRKFPVLGDLPLVGFAFRKERQNLRNSEVMIFLTPKIVIP